MERGLRGTVFIDLKYTRTIHCHTRYGEEFTRKCTRRHASSMLTRRRRRPPSRLRRPRPARIRSPSRREPWPASFAARERRGRRLAPLFRTPQLVHALVALNLGEVDLPVRAAEAAAPTLAAALRLALLRLAAVQQRPAVTARDVSQATHILARHRREVEVRLEQHVVAARSVGARVAALSRSCRVRGSHRIGVTTTLSCSCAPASTATLFVGGILVVELVVARAAPVPACPRGS